MWLAPTLLGLVLLTFIVAHVVPADPAALVAGDTATPAQVALVRQRLGLDQPLPAQFWAYLVALAKGDLGTSLYTGRPIAQDLLARLPPTLELTLCALAAAILGGVPLGVLAGHLRGSAFDYLIRIGTVAGFAVASFWLALMLQLVFAMELDWLPLAGRSTGLAGSRPSSMATIDALLAGDLRGFGQALRHVALPAASLAVPVMATLVRFARAGILDTYDSPAWRYQRAMGVPPRVSLWRYALRHALVAVITQSGLSFGAMLAGSVVIETVFDWPGVGSYAYNSITHSDYPAVMGFVLWSGAAFILVNAIVDLLTAMVDPRTIEA